MMTRKHFEAIAALFAREESLQNGREHNDVADRHADTIGECRLVARRLAADLADYFGTVNPNFDRDRFLAVCRGEKP